MNWGARPCFFCRHLGLLLLVAQEEDLTWAWSVSGRVGQFDVRIEGEAGPSLAHAKNAAVAAAARMARVAA